MSDKDIFPYLVRLENKLDKVTDVQISHGEILTDHVRRSKANEENIELLRSEFAPVKSHVALWGVVGKLVMGFAAFVSLAGTLVGIWAVFK